MHIMKNKNLQICNEVIHPGEHIPLALPHAYFGYALLFFGLGIAAAGQHVGLAIITEHVDQNTRATALGLNNASITLFSALLPPFVSFFIAKATNGQITKATAHSFVTGFSIMPILFAIAFALTLLFIQETFCKSKCGATRLVRD